MAFRAAAMAEIVDLFRGAAFDPETVEVLCAAYEKARASLHDRGQPQIVREIIAQRIIAAAKRGERDPDALCAAGLAGLSGSTAARG